MSADFSSFGNVSVLESGLHQHLVERQPIPFVTVPVLEHLVDSAENLGSRLRLKSHCWFAMNRAKLMLITLPWLAC
jgi:hypothetical protein